MLEAVGVAAGRESELAEVQQTAAAADVTGDNPDAEGVRRFHNWVIDCVTKGGTAAIVAAVAAAANGLLNDAPAMVKAIHADPPVGYGFKAKRAALRTRPRRGESNHSVCSATSTSTGSFNIESRPLCRERAYGPRTSFTPGC